MSKAKYNVTFKRTFIGGTLQGITIPQSVNFATLEAARQFVKSMEARNPDEYTVGSPHKNSDFMILEMVSEPKLSGTS